MPSLSGLMSRVMGRPRPAGPKPPVAAEDYFPTFALSVDKDAPVPTRLIDAAMAAVRATVHEVSLDDLSKREGFPEWFSIWPGEHYRLLAAFIKTLQPRIVVEIGTDTGMSSLAMKKYLPADGKIVTYDVRPWREVEDHVLRDADLADGRLEQRLIDLSDPAKIASQRDLLESTDFFFIDAPKDNVFEYRLLERFRTLNFKRNPIMLWDDTKLISMLKFWQELPYPKLDLTGFGHWSGTGLVEWRNG
jgi:predicted O-methyltransferase YrrM